MALLMWKWNKDFCEAQKPTAKQAPVRVLAFRGHPDIAGQHHKPDCGDLHFCIIFAKTVIRQFVASPELLRGVQRSLVQELGHASEFRREGIQRYGYAYPLGPASRDALRPQLFEG